MSLDAEGRRRVADDVFFITGSGIPTDGTSGTGAGFAGPPSLYFDITNAVIYTNTNTLSSPTWEVFGINNIADGSITTAMLEDLAVTTAKINNDAVTNAKLADDSVDSDQIVDLSIDTAHISLLAITTALINDLAVTGAKIDNATISGVKIIPNSVLALNLINSTFAQSTGTIASADITGTGVGQFGHANGYPIIAAPGLHNIIELISVFWAYDFGVAAYGAGGNVTVNRAAGAGALTGLISAANSFGAAVDKVGLFYPLTTAGLNLTENEGVNLVTAAAFTQPGTAAGVIRYVANYRIHATGL